MSTAEIDRESERERMEPLRKLDKDLKASARIMGQRQVRYLVDTYYSIQHYRTIAANQHRALETVEPGQVLLWVHDNTRALERNIKISLGEFAREYAVGLWAQSIVGIGDVISAGMLAHIDIRRARTAGQIWSLAGLVHGQKWWSADEAKKLVAEVTDREKGKLSDGQQLSVALKAGIKIDVLKQRMAYLDVPATPKGVASAVSLRPWVAGLKTLCFKMSDCFVKFQNHKHDYYGKLYLERRAYEARKNDAGDYRGEAERQLREKKYESDTDAKKAYLSGRLPLGHLHSRAMRWVAKMFLSHLHEVMYRDYFSEAPPVPYTFEKSPDKNHRHLIPIPNYPWTGGGKPLRDLLDKRPKPVK